MIAVHLAIMAVLSVAMGIATRHIATATHAVARGFGVSDFFASVVLLGVATSMPEISVTLFSAARGTPGLSLGNLLGANVVILTFLCGLVAVIAKRVSPADLRRHHTLPFFLANVSLPILAVVDGRLTRMDGVVLILAHAAFLAHEYRGRSRGFLETIRNGGRNGIAKNAAVLAIAVTALLVASYFLVNAALAVAQSLGAAPVVIGLLLFSVGTNIPELTLLLTRARTHKGVVTGDLLGSALMNTPTLGLLALVSPFEVAQKDAVLASCVFLALSVACFGVFIRTKRELSRREGFVLLALYAAYLAYNARFLV